MERACGQGHVLQIRHVIVVATRLQEGTRKDTAQQIQSHLQFDGRRAGARIPAAARPGLGEGVGQSHRRAIEQIDAAGEALQDGNGDGVSGQGSGDGGFKHLPQTSGGLGSETLIQALRGNA
jgi:hypothetical protein